MSGGIDVDLDRLEEVASRLDLRKPNREALESLAFEMSQHFDVDGRPPHCYSGPAFSAAINDLNPRAIVGLTATPDSATPTDQIIYRYPLAAAIAARYVKTPVIVARKDDRRDSLTKLSDGAALLEYKAEQADSTKTPPASPAPRTHQTP